MNTEPGPTDRRVIGAHLAVSSISSPLGEMSLVVSARGVRRLFLPGERVPDELGRNLPAGRDVAPAAVQMLCRDATSQLREYFAGQRRRFEIALDLVGTDFQLSAWRELCRIPFGSTISYGEQARRIGRPTAVRAIGLANGRNPVPVIVPCHRVIGADGSLTGYGGGLAIKQWLLSHEGVVVGGRPDAVAGTVGA